MRIYQAFLLFTIIIVIYLVISEVFTILFRFTGLDEEKARFQVVSLLTGAGYTTAESELVTSSRPRRRLARWTMIFGYVFNITFVSAFVNIFFSFKQTEITNFLLEVAVPLVTTLLIIILIRIPAVRRWADELIRKVIDSIVGQADFNPLVVIGDVGDKTIVSVTVKKVPEELAGKKLRENGLKSKHGIIVLLVENKNQEVSDAHADTIISEGDTVTLYGEYPQICEVFQARQLYVD